MHYSLSGLANLRKPLRKRWLFFLRDVLWFSIRAFGGPQVHVLLMRKLMVEKRRYITENELWELNALCQMLPGPTSTQTITAIGYHLGGPNLAYLTLLVWLLPACTIMITLAIAYNALVQWGVDMAFLRFMQPLAVGFVAHAGYHISRSVCKTSLSWIVMGITTVIALAFQSPYLFPLVFIAGAVATNLFSEDRFVRASFPRIRVYWGNLLLFVGVLALSAIAGSLTHLRLILLFENTYRFGSLVFGGGHVLVPMLHEQFVTYKHYLSSSAFLTGYSLAQAVPGPVFSFTSYLGALALQNWGLPAMIAGGLVCGIGIFLPGTFLIFFLFPIWQQVRQLNIVRHSLEGVNAVGAGLVVSAAIGWLPTITPSNINLACAGLVFVLLQFSRLPGWALVLLGLATGVVTQVFSW